MNKELIEIMEFNGEGYRPLIDFETWRVAVLRYCEELEVDNLKTMQKHGLSDEVFVLLEGSFTLFTGGTGPQITEVNAIHLEPCKLYNVKQGVWHTHTLSPDARVLIVENSNTCDENSPVLPLTKEQITQLKGVYAK